MKNLMRLILRARTGDKTAYNEIVIRFQDMAVGYAYTILKDFHLSQDAAQESFIAAFQELPNLRDPELFPAWFRKIVFKYCDRITRKKQFQSTPIEETMVVSKSPDPLSKLETKESQAQVLTAINRLPEEERQVLTLFYMGEHTYAEIATFLNLSEVTVNNRMRSARKRLKQGLIDMTKESLQQQAPSRNTQFAKTIADLLEDAWSIRQQGNYTKGRKILKEIEEKCADDDDLTWGRIFATYAQYDRDNGDLDSALELSKKSYAYYQKSGNQNRIAHSIRHIADIQVALNQRTEAEENYQKALKIYREHPETKALDLANTLRPYGRLLKNLGKNDEAKPLIQEARACYQKAENKAGFDEMNSWLASFSHA